MGKTISPQWPQLRQCRYHLDLMHAAATHSLQSAVRHINTLIDELAPTPTPCSASTLFDLNPNAPTLRADTSACGDDNASADAEARLFEELRLLISSDCWPAASIAERCSADAATTLAARLNTLGALCADVRGAKTDLPKPFAYARMLQHQADFDGVLHGVFVPFPFARDAPLVLTPTQCARSAEIDRWLDRSRETFDEAIAAFADDFGADRHGWAGESINSACR